MTRSVAVLGANGFIGSRAVEMMHLSGWAEVRPVVRRAAALASASRFSLNGKVADALDTQALVLAFSGCNYVVHAVAGNPALIVNAIDPVYRAAEVAGVRRLIYLSSAAVHGQAPPAGTDETSPLSDRQSIQYNNAKVQAERRLWKLHQKGRVEVVILRPGIVFGPRSRWTGGFANELIAGTAYLVDGGKGICNSAYVDNVIHAVQLAVEVPQADGSAYLIGDTETVTWWDLWKPIADALGFDISEIMVPVPPTFSRRRARYLRGSRVARRLLKVLPKRATSILKASYAEWHRQAVEAQKTSQFEVSQELTLLHRCTIKLSSTKAERELQYRPIVSFEEGCARSRRWLTFAGYPTLEARPTRHV